MINLCARFLGCAAAVLTILGSVWTASAINVTYQVDMSIQKAIGKFNPATDTVFVSGNFSDPDWQSTSTDGAASYTLAASGGDPDIYEGTFAIDVASSDWEAHKFVINPNGTFGVLRWEESIGNRFFQVPATDTNLPVVFFDDVDTLPSSRQVTFQVDMSVQIALTNFNPLTDFVYVAGTFNDWSTTESELSQTVTNTNVWKGTFTVQGVTSNTSPYKFVMFTFSGGEDWELDGSTNRQVLLSAADQIEPLVCFDNLCSLPSESPVTFRVNMAAQMAYGRFTNGIVNTVTAAGQFNGWDPTLFVLTNDPGNPYVYQGTTNIVGVEGSSIPFKYVIDGGVEGNEYWEEDIDDRTFDFSTNSQTLATPFFNDVDNLGAVVTAPAGGNQVDVSWTPGPLIRLQESAGLPGGWTDVPSTTGESNATVTLTTNQTYFRLIGP